MEIWRNRLGEKFYSTHYRYLNHSDLEPVRMIKNSETLEKTDLLNVFIFCKTEQFIKTHELSKKFQTSID